MLGKSYYRCFVKKVYLFPIAYLISLEMLEMLFIREGGARAK
jgi:hypothetical protein